MKKLLAIITVAAITAMAGTAMAATTSTNLDVEAVVVAACTAETTTDINFGNLDPVGDPTTTLASAKTSAGIISVKCTAGTSYSLSAPATAAILNGGNSITYTPVVPTGPFTGIVAGAPHTIDASVAKADYALVPTGTYTGTLTVTVTY